MKAMQEDRDRRLFLKTAIRVTSGPSYVRNLDEHPVKRAAKPPNIVSRRVNVMIVARSFCLGGTLVQIEAGWNPIHLNENFAAISM